jgi:hypothetical protein
MTTGAWGTGGDAVFRGDECEIPLANPIVGLAVNPVTAPDQTGYWLVASDGAVFGFGDAPYRGSVPAAGVDTSIVAIAADPVGVGYWELGQDGTIYPFSAAVTHGNWKATPDIITGMTVTPDEAATGWSTSSAMSSPVATPSTTALRRTLPTLFQASRLRPTAAATGS